MSKFEKLAKALETLSIPQKKLLNKAAEFVGAKGDENDSEKSSAAIVEKLAEKIGIPESSSFGNAAKAAAVAGLDVFADPLGPLGKIGKVGKVAKIADKSHDLTNLQKLNKIKEAFLNKKIELSPETAQRLEKSISAAAPKTMDKIQPEKFRRMGIGVVAKTDEPVNHGKVIMNVKEQDPGMVKISETSKTPAKTIIVSDKTKVLPDTGSVPTDSEDYFKRLIRSRK